ncbi:DMT family transporter [Thalassococcus profundi]|uniref:DMT family transporter n=1 Tax=Thalassococcus profundi TaxID=2282382 RepID=A0A369TQ91_9RHOB|nr:DMT family transporter [Thalassococcus profundi]RDD67438.1 DMT family transporter [Thalassococcus profundi]
MTDARLSFLASFITAGTGMLWGFYWLPVRRVEEAGLSGAWGSLVIVALAALLLMPVAFARRAHLRSADPGALAAVALGGGAFVLYSVGLVYGRVAIVVLLFFLTPVWSVLLARFVLGWHTPRLRLMAIGLGLCGLAVMLSAGGTVPWPRSTGEWCGLVSGLLWSLATTGIRLRPAMAPPEATFIFACGACVMAAIAAPLFAPWTPGLLTQALPSAFGWALAAAGLWWALSMAGLMWATARLEPARVGILLMSEVLVAAVSAAWLAGETLNSVELAGGALVLCAGLFEVWPVRKPRG